MLSHFDSQKPPNVICKPPLRYIEPYFFIFQTHTKGRWLKRPLIQVLIAEFRAYTKQYYLKAIATQLITVNNKPTTADYILKDNDLLTHKTTRVEPPILDLPIKIIKETKDLIVVDKPPGITIHSGGGFHYNTMMGRLFYEHDKKGLYLCHRLDKCTSGVIIFGKNKDISMRFHQNNEKFVTKKMYYARVAGDFDQQKWIEVDMPIACLDHKKGVYAVYEEEKHKQLEEYHKHPIKQSATTFKKLWYDPKTESSLLECYPKTGRTHQIRVHLQYTGHPILNDMVYGGRFVGNNVLMKYFEEDVHQKFMKQNEEVVKKRKEKEQKKQQNGKHQNIEQQKQKQAVEFKQSLNTPQNDLIDKFEKRPLIPSKQQLWQKKLLTKKAKLEYGNYEKVVEPIQGQSLEEDEWDYTNRAMEICLHSYKYIFEGIEYITERPYWFQKDLIPKYERWDKQILGEEGREEGKKYQEKITNEYIFKQQEKVQRREDDEN